MLGVKVESPYKDPQNQSGKKIYTVAMSEVETTSYSDGTKMTIIKK
jgi:hypothetical protein